MSKNMFVVPGTSAAKASAAAQTGALQQQAATTADEQTRRTGEWAEYLKRRKEMEGVRGDMLTRAGDQPSWAFKTPQDPGANLRNFRSVGYEQMLSPVPTYNPNAAPNVPTSGVRMPTSSAGALAGGTIGLPTPANTNFSTALPQVPGYDTSTRPATYQPNAGLLAKIGEGDDWRNVGERIRGAYTAAANQDIGETQERIGGSLASDLARRGLSGSSTGMSQRIGLENWARGEQARRGAEGLMASLPVEQGLREEGRNAALATAGLGRTTAKDLESAWLQNQDLASRGFEQGMTRESTAADLTRAQIAQQAGLSAQEQGMNIAAHNVEAGNINQQAALAAQSQNMGLNQYEAERDRYQAGLDEARLVRGEETSRAGMLRGWGQEDTDLANQNLLQRKQLAAAARGEGRGNYWDAINYLAGDQNAILGNSSLTPIIGAQGDIASGYGNLYQSQQAQIDAQKKMWGELGLGVASGYGNWWGGRRK